MTKILETRKLTKVFPGVKAVDELDFDLEPGEIHAIVGENGAGKSTLIKMLAGVYRPTSGTIIVQGEERTFHNPREAMEYIGVVYQENELIPYFSGYENLFLGVEETASGLLKNETMRERAYALAEEFNFDLDLDSEVRELGAGQQTLIAILKVLYERLPILIFDEPTAALSYKESETLFELLRDLRSKGFAIIYISHHLTEVLDLADRVTVLRDGKKVVTVQNEGLTERQLIQYMIARDIDVQYPKLEANIGETVLQVRDFSDKRYGFEDINFHIRSGEIVGFAGLTGAGRTELAKSIYRQFRKRPGNIQLTTHAADRKRRMVLIPENRREEGVILDLSVRENLILASLDQLSHLGYLIERGIVKYIGSIIEQLAIKVTSPAQSVRTLSGGNQQKVSIGKWMGESCDVWIFDEPTQGIDVDTKTEIYTIMSQLAQQGSAIWFISSDLRELTSICDRIYVMYDFAIAAEFTAPYEREDILTKMMGGD